MLTEAVPSSEAPAEQVATENGSPPTADVSESAPPPPTQKRRKAKDSHFRWIVALGTSIIAILVPSISLCQGLVALYVSRLFPNSSWVSITGLMAAMLAVWNFMGPVTSLLHVCLSSRFLGFIGGLIMATGLSLSFINSDIMLFYWTMGIIAGAGAGLAENTAGKLLKQCFTNRHDAASKVCLLIRLVGQTAMPQCIFFLLDFYGLRGALLIFGATILHVCAAALFFPAAEKGQSCRWPVSERSIQSNQHPNVVFKNSNSAKKKKKKKKKRKKSAGDKDLAEDCRWKNPCKEGQTSRGHRTRTISIDSSRMLPDIPEELEPISEDDNEADDEYEGTQQLIIQCEMSNAYEISVPSTRIRQESITSSASFTSSGEWERSRDPTNASMPSLYSASSLSLTSSVCSESHSGLGSSSTICTNELRPNNNNIPSTHFVVHLRSLLTDPMLWILTISCTLFTLSNSSVLFYLPFKLLNSGLSDHGIANSLSFYIAANMVGRLFAMWVHSKRFAPQVIVTTMAFLNLVSIAVLTFAQGNISHFMAFAAFGWTSGGCSVIIAPILSYRFRSDFHESAIVVLQIAQGFVFLSGSPLIGFLVENTSNVVSAFWIIIVLQGLSVFFWSLLPLAHRCGKRRQLINNLPRV